MSGFYGLHVFMSKYISRHRHTKLIETCDAAIAEWCAIPPEQQEKMHKSSIMHLQNDAFGFETYVMRKLNPGDQYKHDREVFNNGLRAWTTLNAEEKKEYNELAQNATLDQRVAILKKYSFQD